MPTDKRTFKIGIWFPLRPFAPLTGEGIFRLLCRIIKSTTGQENTSALIATTVWTRQPLEDQLRDNGVPLEEVEIFTSRRRIPLAVGLLSWLMMSRPRKRRWRRIRSLIRRLTKWTPLQGKGISLLMTDSYLVAIGVLLPLSIVLLGLVCLFLPFWVIGNVILSPRWRRALRVRLLGSEKLGRWRLRYRRFLTEKRARWRLLSLAVRDNESRRLADNASRRNDVDVWFIPHPWAVEATRLGKPLVVAIPDAVYADFPTLFPGPEMAIIDRRIREVLASARKAITYSEYVRRHHVEKYLGGEDEKTTVITHAPMDISHHLQDMTDRHAGDSRQAALAIIRKYIARDYRPPAWAENLPVDYLQGFPFDEVPFLFASSQFRMHKNFLNLFKAFEVLLRRRHLNVKLFITGRLEARAGAEPAATLREFLKQHRLELDVISVPNLPSDVHAAFYHLAALTVVPSLFEGGLPFPFTESLSVQTPVVMSSIPVNLEVLPEELTKITLFDPYSVEDMCEKIEWGVAHRDELLQEQMHFYRELQSRTWDDVAADYLKVLKAAVENARETS